jgi:hypothetical protein
MRTPHAEETAKTKQFDSQHWFVRHLIYASAQQDLKILFGAAPTSKTCRLALMIRSCSSIRHAA